MSTEPTMQERLDRLDEEKARVSLGGGQDKIEKQHERGKLTAPHTSAWIRPMLPLTVW